MANELVVFEGVRKGIMVLDLHQRLYPLKLVGAPPLGERGIVSMGPRWAITRNGA